MVARLKTDIGNSVLELKSFIKDFEIKKKLYKILFMERGYEFDGYREYTPMEDSSLIDWKATFRVGKTLVRKYKDEQDLKIFFVVDVGDNMIFGSGEKLKCEYAAEVAAALSYLIVNSGDYLGYMLFSNRIKETMPCKKGKATWNLFVDHLTKASYYGGKSNLNLAFDWLMKKSGKSFSSLIVISDFIGCDENLKFKIKNISDRYETLFISIKDIIDVEMPNIAREVVIESPGGGKQLVINPRLISKAYREYVELSINKFKNFLMQEKIDYLELLSSEKFAPRLATFLKSRIRRAV